MCNALQPWLAVIILVHQNCQTGFGAGDLQQLVEIGIITFHLYLPFPLPPPAWYNPLTGSVQAFPWNLLPLFLPVIRKNMKLDQKSCVFIWPHRTFRSTSFYFFLRLDNPLLASCRYLVSSFAFFNLIDLLFRNRRRWFSFLIQTYVFYALIDCQHWVKQRRGRK